MNLSVSDGVTHANVPAPVRNRDLAIIAVAGLLLYGLNVDFWLYGDSALYADYSLRRKFTEVTLHMGYYWLVIGAQATFGTLLRIPIQETMGWLNVVFGAGMLCVSYLLGLVLLGTRRNALLTVAVLALSGRMMTNATSAEIYITQTFFVLLSFLLFTQEKIAWSAAAAAASVLVSPLSIFAFLFYPVYDYQRTGKIRWGVLVKLGVIALLVYSPYLGVYGHELLWGRRGLLVISGSTATEPMVALRNFPKYQFKQYTVMLLLFLPALLAIRKHARFFVLAAAVSIPHIYIILKLTGEDNVFILNTDFFSAAILVFGWVELSRYKFAAWIGPALLAGHVALLLASGGLFAFKHHRDYAEEMRGVYNTYLRDKDASLIMDWGTAAAFTFYARDSATTGLLEEPVFARVYDLENEPQADPHVLDKRELYVLDRYNPTPLNQLLSSKESIKQQYEDHSFKNIAERRLNLTCTLLQERTNRLYHCVRKGAPAS